MKIGFDAKRLYNNFTGLGNYSRTLVGNLIQQYPEDKIYLYTPKLKIEPLTNAVTRQPLKKSFVWRSWGVKRDLRADGIELYHGLSHDLPFGIHKTGIRSVVTIHDVCYKTFPKMFPLVERMIYDVKYRYSCRHADRIIAISESTKADIISYLGVDAGKIEVIYQSINPLFYSRQDEPRQTISKLTLPEKYMLYVGSINSRKNLLGIVKAYATVAPEYRLPLVVVGNGSSYKKQVVKYLIDNHLTENVIMLDSVDDLYTIQALYQCAELFIYPSFYEGFGLPVTEALLSGTPTITSNISSLPEAGGDAAIYVNPSQPEEIAEAITRALSDPELRKKMVERGLEYAHSKFNPELLTKQVHDLYNEIQRSNRT